MARYIDADKLCKAVLASWDKDNHKTIEASRVHRQEHHHLMSIIEKQPIADVVPKSEIEKVVGQIAQQEMDSYEAIYKQEVAREIFEDIEKYYKEKIYLLMDMPTYLAELKKKYTESEE